MVKKILQFLHLSTLKVLISFNIKAENTGRQCRKSATFIERDHQEHWRALWSGLTDSLSRVMVLGPQYQRADNKYPYYSFARNCDKCQKTYKSLRMNSNFYLDMTLWYGEKDVATLKILLIVKSVTVLETQFPISWDFYL